MPTLIVVGDEDTLTTPAVSREMQRRIPGARMTVIERAGHLSNIEQPEAFNRAVLDCALIMSVFILAHFIEYAQSAHWVPVIFHNIW